MRLLRIPKPFDHPDFLDEVKFRRLPGARPRHQPPLESGYSQAEGRHELFEARRRPSLPLAASKLCCAGRYGSYSRYSTTSPSPAGDSLQMSAIGQTGAECNPIFPPMTYAQLASLHVVDSLQLSSASREMTELFRVIAHRTRCGRARHAVTHAQPSAHDPGARETREHPRQGCADAFFRH